MKDTELKDTIPCTIKIKYIYPKVCIFCEKPLKHRKEYIPITIKRQIDTRCYACRDCTKELLNTKGFNFNSRQSLLA